MQKIAIILAKWGIPFFTLLIVVATALSSEFYVAANAAKTTSGPTSCTLLNDNSGTTKLKPGSGITGLTDDADDKTFSLQCGSSSKGSGGGTNGGGCSSDEQTPSSKGKTVAFCQALDGTIQGTKCDSGTNPDTFTPSSSGSFKFHTDKKNDPCTAIVWDFTNSSPDTASNAKGCQFSFNAKDQTLLLNVQVDSGKPAIPTYTSSSTLNNIQDGNGDTFLKGVQKVFLDTIHLKATDLTIPPITYTCG